ncbi:MAG: MATE family efflux transporter [Treponema sp.]|nr:MATE family efflux transporter [Treponema sp.]
MEKSNTVSKMTTAPVGPLILKNAIPTIITMMVTAIYNTADTFFVSKLGTSASGAVGIIFSLMSLIQAVGFTIGMGSGSITSRALGANDLKRASKYCTTAICLGFTTGIVFSILGTIFNRQIATSLGATPTILPYAMDYARYIIFACPFMVTSLVMNNQLRFQGKAIFSMCGMAAGGILNMFLDPLFIFVFDMGISGAAIATFISQVASFFILLSVFVLKKSTAEFAFKNIAREIKSYLNIVTTGLPSLFRQGTASVASIFMNIQAAKYGALITVFAMTPAQPADAAVAGMAITNRIFQLLLSVAIGMGQGFQPVCGMNLGAEKYGRVRASYSFLVKITTVIMAVFGILVFVFAPEIAHIFRDDEAVISVASLAMRCQACVLPFHSLIFGTNMLFQVAGVKKRAIVLSSMRQGWLFVPLVFILPHIVRIFGAQPIFGVQLTQTVSDLISAAVAVPFMMNFFKKLGK